MGGSSSNELFPDFIDNFNVLSKVPRFLFVVAIHRLDPISIGKYVNSEYSLPFLSNCSCVPLRHLAPSGTAAAVNGQWR